MSAGQFSGNTDSLIGFFLILSSYFLLNRSELLAQQSDMRFGLAERVIRLPSKLFRTYICRSNIFVDVKIILEQ